MQSLFQRTIEHFVSVDIVIANAGIMESKSVFDFGAADGDKEPAEPQEGYKVLDVNLKGSLNSTLPCLIIA